MWRVRKYVEGEKVTFPVPIHAGEIVKQGTLKGILRKAGITPEQLQELLK